jgi:hypothetical protein
MAPGGGRYQSVTTNKSYGSNILFKHTATNPLERVIGMIMKYFPPFLISQYF